MYEENFFTFLNSVVNQCKGYRRISCFEIKEKTWLKGVKLRTEAIYFCVVSFCLYVADWRRVAIKLYTTFPNYWGKAVAGKQRPRISLHKFDML